MLNNHLNFLNFASSFVRNEWETIDNIITYQI